MPTPVVRTSIRWDTNTRWAHTRGLGCPFYLAKERKGRTHAELDKASEWLTAFDAATVQRLIAEGATFEQFFAQAHLNPEAGLIAGVTGGVRKEDIESLLAQEVRHLDKLVDELAKGKAMGKSLRVAPVGCRPSDLTEPRLASIVRVAGTAPAGRAVNSVNRSCSAPPPRPGDMGCAEESRLWVGIPRRSSKDWWATA